MKKIAFLLLFVCVFLSFVAAQGAPPAHLTKINVDVPYPYDPSESDILIYTVTFPTNIIVEGIGGEAGLSWSWSGNKATCTTTVGAFREFIRSFDYSGSKAWHPAQAYNQLTGASYEFCIYYVGSYGWYQ